MHVLLATDAQWVTDDVVAALASPDTNFTVCSNGRDVTAVVKRGTPDIAILDLQSGSMGGMAVAMNLRHDESGGLADHVPVLMLLDREADVFLARRSGADAWLVKPINPLSLQKAVRDILDPPASAPIPADEQEVWTGETAEEEPAPAG